jgi:hypothetical protein
VDFDTSHVQAFTQRFNHTEDISESEWVDGARIVAGWPGDSEMMPERIPGYVKALEGYGIEMVVSVNDLFGKIDAVMIESQQGSRHLERARPFLEAGIPTFVDKPFAGTVQDADSMIALAVKHNAPLLSCSALRFDPTIGLARAAQTEYGKLLSADVWGACALDPGNPGLLHYGIHGVEMLYSLLGPGFTEVRMVRTPEGEVATALWNNQPSTLRGIRAGQYGFGFVAHYEKGNVPYIVEGAAFYRELLNAFVAMCLTGDPPVPYVEMREVMTFISAADLSAESGGAAEQV